MIKWFALAARFLHEEDGPTAVEYAIMLALIILDVSRPSRRWDRT